MRGERRLMLFFDFLSLLFNSNTRNFFSNFKFMDNNIQLELGAIKALQKYVGEKIKERGFEDETLHERLVLLMEEVGELAKACRKVSGMYIESDKEIKYKAGEEIADVINVAFAVGIELGIDIEKEFFNKEARNDQRLYKRSSENREKNKNQSK